MIFICYNSTVSDKTIYSLTFKNSRFAMQMLNIACLSVLLLIILLCNNISLPCFKGVLTSKLSCSTFFILSETMKIFLPQDQTSAQKSLSIFIGGKYEMKRNSFKRVAAGALAVLTISAYSLPADVGIFSNRPVLSAYATGTQNSIHVYGAVRNFTGADMTISYVPQQNGYGRARDYVLKNGQNWKCDGDIVKITCAEKVRFPKEWNYDHPKNANTPHVDDITTETETENGFEYTFSSPQGNTYQYENSYYVNMEEAIFTSIGTCTCNDASTHTLRDGKTVEAHNFGNSTVKVLSNNSYAFVETDSGVGCWKSNNKGKDGSTAATTWEVTVPKGEIAYINYWVSCEANNDFFSISVDNKTPVSEASDQCSGLVMLNEGTHSVTAKYGKSSEDNFNIDTAYIQFVKYCPDCGYTNSRVFMHVEDDITNGLAVKGASQVMLPLYSPMSAAYWCQGKFTIYSNDPLFITDNGKPFDYETEIGSFKYENKNYFFKYNVEIPSIIEGHFIYVLNDGYEEGNEWFYAEPKAETAYNGSKLTTDDFDVIPHASLSEEDAAHFNELLNDEATIKRVYFNYGDGTTASEQSAYYILYNPELGLLSSHCEFDLPARQINAEDIITAGDLITYSNEEISPADYVKVAVNGNSGNKLELKKDTDYTATAAAENTGEYTVTVEGINNCTGKNTVTVNTVNASELTKVEANEATCLDGNIEYYTCTNGKFYQLAEGYTNVYNEISEEDIVLTADKAHTFAPAWKWANKDGDFTASAKLVCGICGAEESYEADVESSETDDDIIYTASFTAEDGTVYTDTKTIAKSFTFTVNGGSVAGEQKDSYSYGEAVTVTAEDMDAETGKYFSGWYYNDSLVSTKKEYTFYVTANAEVTAKYEIVADDEAEALETLADISMIIERIDLIDGTGRQNAKFTVNWSLPNNCNLLNAGIIRAYSTEEEEIAEADLTIENADGSVIKNVETSLRTQSGTFLYDFNMKDTTKVKTINARAYIVFENGDGNELVIYTDLLKSVYAQ